jgi:hypothetical protein
MGGSGSLTDEVAANQKRGRRHGISICEPVRFPTNHFEVILVDSPKTLLTDTECLSEPTARKNVSTVLKLLTYFPIMVLSYYFNVML